MTRAGTRPPADAPTWSAVSAERPCPCCGEVEGCGTAEQAGFVHCRLLVSSRPIVGGGWLSIPRSPRPRGVAAGWRAQAPLATGSSS